MFKPFGAYISWPQLVLVAKYGATEFNVCLLGFSLALVSLVSMLLFWNDNVYPVPLYVD